MTSESIESTQSIAPTPNRRNSPVRDVVTIGISIALYIVLFLICGMITGAIPLITVLFPVILGIFGGLIFMVLLDKAQRIGISLITGLVTGLTVIPIAPGGVMCYMTTAGGVVTEVIYWLMSYKLFASMTAAYTAFVIFFTFGEYIPLVWMKDAYLGLHANNPTLDVAKVGMDMPNSATMATYCPLAIVACVAGCFQDHTLARRQPSRAGIVRRIMSDQDWMGSLFPGNLNSQSH